MGTKNNTGEWDCYSQAEPDEPMFVLLGRDPTAGIVVTFWRALKMAMVERGTSKSSKAKLDEARECSVALELWAKKLGKDPKQALEAMNGVLLKAPGSLLNLSKEEQALFHLREASKLVKPDDIPKLIEAQRAVDDTTVETTLVCSMLYAAGEAFNHEGIK